MTVNVKICGLSTADAVAAAVDGGAALVGFVFFAASPRAVTPIEAKDLSANVPKSVTRVGLVVDADDATLADILAEAPLDLLQLHGDETPERVAEIKARFDLPVMKAVGIGSAADVARAREYEDAADRLMFDARPPEGAERPGGNALAFDWELIRDAGWRRPWVLAGGLTAANLAQAVAISGADTVDVSSGVEAAPGVKSLAKIREFLAVAAGL